MLAGDVAAWRGARGGVASPSGRGCTQESARRFGVLRAPRAPRAAPSRPAARQAPQCCSAPLQPLEAPARKPRRSRAALAAESATLDVAPTAPPGAAEEQAVGAAAAEQVAAPAKPPRELTTRRKLVPMPLLSPATSAPRAAPRAKRRAKAKAQPALEYSEANALSETEAAGALPAEVLTACLAGAKTSERVLRLAAAHVLSLNAIHVAAALDALGSIFVARRGSAEAAAAFAADERTAALLELGAALAPEMSPRDLVAALRGCARLSHDPGPAFQAAWERAAAASAARFRPRDVAGAAWCYGQLKLRAGPAWDAARDALYDALAPDMRPEELAAVYWGHGRMQAPPSRASRAALGAAAAAACASDMLGSRELANVLWGAASWLGPAPRAAPLVPGAPAPAPPAGKAAAAWAEQVARSGTPRLREASAQELSNIAFALARMGASPDAAWRAAFYAAFGIRMAERAATPQHLAAALAALAQLPPQRRVAGGAPEAPPAEWMAAFWAQSRGALPRSSASQVVNTFTAAARLRLMPPRDWLDAFWARSAVLLRLAPPAEAAATLAAAAALGAQPPLTWQRALWTEPACHGLRGASCADVARAAQALVALRLRPPEHWMAEFAATASRSMAAGEGKALEQLLLAFLALLPEEGLVSSAAAALPERLLAETLRRGQEPAGVAVVSDEWDEQAATAA